VHGDLHIGNIITDGERHLWIDVGEFAYGAPEWDLALLWTMCHNMPDDRVQHIFHITHDQMQAHWDIFFPAYLGTSDPQAIAEATRKLMPYYAAKVPYIFDMVFNAPMPDAALQRIVQLF
jgi:aminoglycoside phosphotransferase (APT) family kinase protein